MTAPARSYKTAAVVLRGRNYGEADRIFTFFSLERGKLDAIAKGVRRQKSRLGGRLEFANEVALMLHRGRNLDVVASAEIERANWPQIVEPERFAAANVIIELIDAFCEPDLALPDVYELLTAALAAIGRSNEPMSLLPRFSLRLLGMLGWAPPVEACVRCGSPLEGSAWLDLEQGGFVGAECHCGSTAHADLDAEDISNLQAVATARGSDAKAALRARPRVAKAIDSLVHYHLGRRPKSTAHAVEFA